MTDGTEQVGLSSWSTLNLVESGDIQIVDCHVDPGIRYPDCGQRISETKGGQPLPDGIGADRTFVWRCSDCHNVVPCLTFKPEADTFNDKYRGIEVEFRGGHERSIPVPVRSVDTETE